MFTHMYLTISIEPSLFSQALPPRAAFPYISPQSLFLLLPTHCFFIRSLKKIEEQIHNLPSRETISDRRT